MSLVAAGHQYIRDSVGIEQLYDLTKDPHGRLDLMKTAEGKERVESYRTRLLKLLTTSPGSAEVEHAYLNGYRKQLQVDVEKDTQPRLAHSH